MQVGIAAAKNDGEMITLTIIAEPHRRTKDIVRWTIVESFLKNFNSLLS